MTTHSAEKLDLSLMLM